MPRALTLLLSKVLLLTAISTCHCSLTPQAVERARKSTPLGPDPNHCAVVFHRHVHKMAGSTVRKSFLDLRSRAGYFYWGYWQTKEEWDDLIAALKEVEPDTVPLPRLYVEIHAEMSSRIFVSHFLPDIRELKSTYKAKQVDCPVLLFTLARNPIDFYFSYFEWRGLPKLQIEDPDKYGKSFEQWMPSNLESRLFYYAHIKWTSLDGVREDEESSNVQNKPMNPSTLNELKSILFNDFDIVGTVERFNDSMQLLAQMAGIPSIRMGKVTPRGKDYVEKSSFCPDLEECIQYIKEHAQYDLDLFQEVSRAFDERMKKEQLLDSIVYMPGENWNSNPGPCLKSKVKVKDGFNDWEVSCDALSLPYNVLEVYYKYRDFETPYTWAGGQA